MEKIVALKNMPISFPGLFGDWEFNPDPIAIHVGHGVYWYGIIIAIAMLAGLYLALKQCKRFGLTEDDVMDMLLAGVPSCIIGARLYYVIFYLDLYRNPDGSLNFGDMIAIWDGGLAIYGAVIAGAIAAFFVARHKKLKLGALTDLSVMGLILGQCIGRWANFINREAFGGLTDLPWRMRLWTSATEFIEVHPTFLYESLWCALGFVLLHVLSKKAYRFKGQVFCGYLVWYGVGRFFIEGLRTDSLYIPGSDTLRVSQLLAAATCFAAVVTLMIFSFKKHSAEKLYVNQIAALEAEKAAEAESSEEEEEEVDEDLETVEVVDEATDAE